MASTIIEAVCVDCGRVKKVRWNAELNRGRCRACRARAAPKEPCGECGREMRVNARRADGAALCGTCYARTRSTTDRCEGCGSVGPLAARAGGRGGHTQNLCVRCYRHPKRPCGVCGRTRRVALKATADGPDICPTCYQAPMIDCSVCGNLGLGRRATKNGKPWCFACQATEHIDSVLAGADGEIPAKLKDVRDVLVARAGVPSLVSSWRRTRSLRLLARLAEQPDQITHDVLDAEGDRFSVTYLRALLVATGVLPERDEQASRLDRWATALLADVEPVEHRQLLTRYARWHVIARAKPDRHGELRPNVADRCRQEIRIAQRFLAHLLERGTDLDQCRQADIDAWFTGRHAMKVRSRPGSGPTARSPMCRCQCLSGQRVPATGSTRTSNGPSSARCCTTRRSRRRGPCGRLPGPALRAARHQDRRPHRRRHRPQQQWHLLEAWPRARLAAPAASRTSSPRCPSPSHSAQHTFSLMRGGCSPASEPATTNTPSR